MHTITVNGVRREVQAPTDTPLLYVLRNDLELSGPQFGCGLAQCGACSVLLGGKEIRSCVTPLSAATTAGNHHTRRAPRALGQTERTCPLPTPKRRSTPCSKPGSKSKRPSADSARTA